MKKHHLLLILLLVSIAAFLLNETRKLRTTESNVRAELGMLRAAVKKSSGAAASSTLGRDSSRPPAIEPAKFTADLADMLKSGAIGQSLQDFQAKYQSQLASAPVKKLKEICELLEQTLMLDQADSKIAHDVWITVLGLAAKSDPAWAFAQFDQAAATAKVPIDAALDQFKNWATLNGVPMNTAYAGALQKWLDTAQGGGRIVESNPLVAELRSQIAVAQGNSSEAVKQISQLPYTSQRKVAVDYIKGLETPEARRKAVEELSTVLDGQIFPQAVGALADQQGFDAAREILGSAALTPEKHDLAAANIAAANIGPETPAKAKWLLESLRSEDTRPITEFTDRWTHADYQGATQWINSLPTGKQRDAAVAGFAPVAAKIDGASAVDWVLTLSDVNQRRSSLSEVVRQWKQKDPEAASTYLIEKGINAE